MTEDARRPLDSMDLGGKGGDDQARLIENLIARPTWILLTEAFAHRVMLACK